MRKLPPAKNENIVEQDLRKELLLYDFSLDKAFSLKETATIIYRGCGQKTAFDDIKKDHKLTDDLIFLTLEKLEKAGLVEKPEYAAPFAGLKRREIIRQVGLGTMIALPVVTSFIVPPPAAAASPVCRTNGQTCDDVGDFTQRNCCPNQRCGTVCFRCSTGSFTFSANSLQCTGTQSSCNAACDASIRKNTCCNSGTATAQFISPASPGQGNYTCNCP